MHNGTQLLNPSWGSFTGSASAGRRQRVEKGFAWLKESGPLYGMDYRRIQPRLVAVDSVWLCPLGQASGVDFNAAVRRLEIQHLFTTRVDGCDWIAAHGFDVGPLDPYHAYAELSGIWNDVLTREHGAART